MSETTFEAMQRRDVERLEHLRKKGKNVPDYTYDESIKYDDTIELTSQPKQELIEDNNKAIVETAKEQNQPAQDANAQNLGNVEAGVIHTNKQPTIDKEKGGSGDER